MSIHKVFVTFERPFPTTSSYVYVSTAHNDPGFFVMILVGRFFKSGVVNFRAVSAVAAVADEVLRMRDSAFAAGRRS